MLKIIKASLVALLCLATLFIVYTWTSGASLKGFRLSWDGLRISRNFYPLDHRRFFRSAQLTPLELEAAIKRYGIKSIINLQGERPGYDWFDEEVAVAKKYHVDLYNYALTTESIPKTCELRPVLEALKTAKRPVLVHCRSGSDRTGEIAAIYAMEYMGESKEQALGQLSGRYWHFSWLNPAADYFIRNVWQGFHWAEAQYNHCDPQWRYSDRRDCPAEDQRKSPKAWASFIQW